MPTYNKHLYFNQDSLSAHAEDTDNSEMDDYADLSITENNILQATVPADGKLSHSTVAMFITTQIYE